MGPKRECKVVDAGVAKELDLEIVVPVEDMAEPGAASYPSSDGNPPEGEPLVHVRSIWPAIYPELLKLVQEHTSTIIFVNNRRASERLAKRLNELNPTNLSRSSQLPSTLVIRSARTTSFRGGEGDRVEDGGEAPARQRRRFTYGQDPRPETMVPRRRLLAPTTAP